MSVLSFDPGAKRCGWANLEKSLDDTPVLLDSGILGLDRTHNEKNAVYQTYRLALIDYWIDKAYELVGMCQPEVIVTEIVPVVGGGNFVVAADSQLVGTVVTTIQTIAKLEHIKVEQISAGRVKRKIGGVKDASKVKVRNGVFEFFPDLITRKKEFVKVFDETDAIAVGLCSMGYAI